MPLISHNVFAKSGDFNPVQQERLSNNLVSHNRLQCLRKQLYRNVAATSFLRPRQ